MRTFLLGAALCAFASSTLADPADYVQPQASLYLSFAFDKPPTKLGTPEQAALRYGFQLDQDWDKHFSEQRDPILRWEFSHLKFDNLSIRGTPPVQPRDDSACGRRRGRRIRLCKKQCRSDRAGHRRSHSCLRHC